MGPGGYVNGSTVQWCIWHSWWRLHSWVYRRQNVIYTWKERTHSVRMCKGYVSIFSGLRCNCFVFALILNLLCQWMSQESYTKFSNPCQGEGWEGGILREFVVDTCTLLYLKWKANKDLVCSRGNSAQCYMGAWVAGRGDTCMCMCVAVCICMSFHCWPETITTVLIGYTPIQNKKSKIIFSNLFKKIVFPALSIDTGGNTVCH